MRRLRRICFPLVLLTAAAVSAGDGPSSDRFGIFSVPRGRDAAKLVKGLGVGWVRVQIPMGERRKNPAKLLSHDLALWLTLYHRDAANADDKNAVPFPRSHRGGYPPRDPERYRRLVTETVRPYIEGLRKRGKKPAEWLVIQVGNEVAPRDLFPPDKPGRFFHGTAKQYVAMFDLARRAVKELDPAVPVAPGGIASEMLEACIAGKKEAVSWAERLIRETIPDWLDLHLFHRVEDIPRKVAFIRKRFAGPLAATEVGGPDIATGARQSDEGQVADLKARIEAATSAGIRRLFWVQVKAIPHADKGTPRYSLMALAREDGTKKPAYDAYRRIVAATAK